MQDFRNLSEGDRITEDFVKVNYLIITLILNMTIVHNDTEKIEVHSK